MRKFTLLLALTLVLAVGCSSSKPSASDDSSSSTASDGTEQTASTPVTMDIAMDTVDHHGGRLGRSECAERLHPHGQAPRRGPGGGREVLQRGLRRDGPR